VSGGRLNELSKTIVSPVKLWPGEVILSDPLTFPQVFAIEDVTELIQKDRENITERRAEGLWIPAILACVEEFHLDNFPEHPTFETWPASPDLSRVKLISWLIGEITNLFKEANEIPNA
jgi:hypothetical protein